MPYPVMNTLIDAGLPGGRAQLLDVQLHAGLSDALIDLMIERFASVPSPMSAILLEHFHGAVTRVPEPRPRCRTASPATTCCCPRSGSIRPTRPAASPGPRTPTRRFSEHLSGRRWLNYLGDDQRDDAIRAAYGPNYDRLVDVKRRYDPENVFHLNHNIAPSGPA